MTFVVGSVGQGDAGVDLSGATRVVTAAREDEQEVESLGEGWLRVTHGAPGSLASLVAVARDERYTVLFVGFTFGAQGEAAAAAQALLADAARDEGRIRPPKGHYTLVVADGERQEARAYVDHLATSPLYYHQWQGRTWFASELKALLPVGQPGKRWNSEVLLQSYLLGFALDEATLCREVACLPGGTCLVMRPGEAARVERYHELAASGETSLRSFQQGGAEYLEGGVRNVQRTFRRLGYAPLATVSGGLDSRAILAMLAAGGAEDLVTVGWGQPGSADAEVGAAVARALGAHHLARPYDGGRWLLETMDEAVDASECMCSYLDAARIVELLRQGLPSGRGPLYTGLSGDMVMGSFINWRDLLHRRQSTDLPGLAPRLAVEYTNVSFHGLDAFARHLGDEPVARVVAAVAGSLEAGLRPGESFFNHLDRWNLRNKQARGIFAYFRGAAGRIPVFSPFYDPDLIDLVRGLPPRHRFTEAAYVQYLVQRLFDDQLAAMPWQKSGTPPRPGLYRNVARVWAKKVAGKLTQRAYDPFADPTNANPYNLWLARDAGLRGDIRDGLVEPGVGSLLQLDEPRLRALLDRWVRDPSDFGAINLNLIYMLAAARFVQRHGAGLSTA